jgi:hypothetical protein
MPPRHKAEDLGDGVILERLLSHGDQLMDDERAAFQSMLEKGKALSVVQRDWVNRVYKRNGLAKKFKGTKSNTKFERKPYFWELEENKPLKPPGR